MSKVFILCSLIAAIRLAMFSPPLAAQGPNQAKLECRLIVPAKNVKAGDTLIGAVEIKNAGERVIFIMYNNSAWEFLDLHVTDPAGKLITPDRYGGRFSPSTPSPQRKLTLRPGETYSGAVDVFGSSKEIDRNTPGEYRVVATFEYGKCRAVAQPVVVKVGSD